MQSVDAFAPSASQVEAEEIGPKRGPGLSSPVFGGRFFGV